MEKSLRTALMDWNFWGSFQVSLKDRPWYLREIEKLDSRLIIALGVRRSGKSYLIYDYLIRKIKQKEVSPEETLILNFEDPRLRTLTGEQLLELIEDVEVEFNITPKYILLDEVQHITEWAQAVRTIHDTKKLKKIFVTGSNSALLSEEYITALSGRYLLLEVYPLSFSEFLLFNGLEIETKHQFHKNEKAISKFLREFLEFGAFPAVVLNSAKKERLLNYYDTILLKDVAERLKLRDVKLLVHLSKFIFSNIGKPFSLGKMASVFQISIDSVKRYLEQFSDAYLTYMIPKFDYSLKKQIFNPKKAYAVDTGLRNVIGFSFSEDFGRVIENAVFVELLRRGKEVYYWKNGREVDFVVHQKKSVELINVTAGDEIHERETEGLLLAMDHFRVRHATLITLKAEKKIKQGNKTIEFIPAAKWLLEPYLN